MARTNLSANKRNARTPDGGRGFSSEFSPFRPCYRLKLSVAFELVVVTKWLA
jgi:hypothetical protein